MANVAAPDQHGYSPCQLPTLKVDNGRSLLAGTIIGNLSLVESRFTLQMTDYAPPIPLARTALEGSLFHSHISYAQKPGGVTFLEVREGETSPRQHSRRTEQDTWGESNPIGGKCVLLKQCLLCPPCHLRETWMGEWGATKTESMKWAKQIGLKEVTPGLRESISN